ncbi:MAG: hypothetical protein H0W50_08905, partial [Parachlamydiaceae bacterium]|nr:hypothetical protein [Parachlamydiaceae bacterium]
VKVNKPVSCCIAIQFNHGGVNTNNIAFENRPKVKKQFVFKNVDCSHLMKEELILKINSLSQILALSIENEIDVETTSLNFGCVMLHQHSQNAEIKASYISFSATEILFNQITSTSNANVGGVLRFVYTDLAEVVSEQNNQIIAGPDCVTV